ncbi:uncharacterized protein LOC143212311 [Lasioglossum baleicum]|uniref:uncharacterized protein LOC143212311 n=1 Tax=Lasioglossum baleicum TaxID=434251 RepID=UPI003FCC948A
MIAIAVFLALAGCSVALPVAMPSGQEPLVGVPVLIQDPAGFRPGEESSPMVYGLVLSRLSEPEPEETGNVSPIEKRSATVDDGQEADDLETAAGTYALRPLFVYRQQLAYRERVREAYRRGNRF